MTATKTVTVRINHKCSIPGAIWCEPIGWEPTNVIDGSEFTNGSWWDESEETAGIAWFGNHCDYSEGETAEVSLEDLRVVSTGNCCVIGNVEM